MTVILGEYVEQRHQSVAFCFSGEKNERQFTIRECVLVAVQTL